jgi:hypothetical protein
MCHFRQRGLHRPCDSRTEMTRASAAFLNSDGTCRHFCVRFYRSIAADGGGVQPPICCIRDRRFATPQ